MNLYRARFVALRWSSRGLCAVLLVLGCSANADSDQPKTRQGTWRHQGREDDNLCHVLVERLNRFNRNESVDDQCSFPVIESYPEFSAPDWVDLNVPDNAGLVAQLLKYTTEGPGTFFGDPNKAEPLNTDAHYREEAKRLLKEGARMRVVRTRFIGHFTDPATGATVPASPGSQNVVQLYMPMSPEEQIRFCPGKPKPQGLTSWAFTYLLIRQGESWTPDRQVDPGTFGILSSHDLKMLRGAPILLNGESLWRDGPAGIRSLCTFEFTDGNK